LQGKSPKKKGEPNPEKARSDLQAIFRDGWNKDGLVTGGWQDKVRDYVKRNPKDTAQVIDDNTNAMNDLYNLIAFDSDKYKQDPLSRWAMQDIEMRARIPLGHENSASLGSGDGKNGMSTGKYGLNVKTVEDNNTPYKRGQILLPGAPDGNKETLGYVLRHEGTHDIPWGHEDYTNYGSKSEESLIRMIDDAYVTANKDDKVRTDDLFNSADVKYGYQDSLIPAVTKFKDKLGSYHNPADESKDQQTREYGRKVDYTTRGRDVIDAMNFALDPRTNNAKHVRDLPKEGTVDSVKAFFKDLLK